MRHPAHLDAYALGSLDDEATGSLEAHLASCRRCRSEVRRLRERAALAVAALPPVAPDPALRARVLEAVRPEVEAARASARRERPRPPRPGALAVATLVAAAAVVAAGALLVDQQRSLRQVESERALVAAWLTRDDVTTHPLPAATEADRSPGSVIVALDGTVLVVLRTPPPTGSEYQVWGLDDAAAVELARSAGTVMRVNASGFREVGISIEPSGGSPQPTDQLGRVSLTGI